MDEAKQGLEFIYTNVHEIYQEYEVISNDI